MQPNIITPLKLIYAFDQSENTMRGLYKAYGNNAETKSYFLLTFFMYNVQGLCMVLILILTNYHSEKHFRGPLEAPFLD
jgi:hypothetical protein